jgi:hypothetical protein
MTTAKRFFSNPIGYPIRLVVLLSSLWFACEEHGIIVKVPGDHFPLHDGVENAYKEEMFNSDKSMLWYSDTLTLTVQGDTLIEGVTYKKVVNQYGLLNKVVRKEGTKYFGRNHELYGGFSKEFMFLDTNLPANASWEHIKDEGRSMTEYVVMAVNSKQVINGVEYENVIQLDVNYYTKAEGETTWHFSQSARHSYAAGIGEIYAYYQDVSSVREFSILSPGKN